MSKSEADVFCANLGLRSLTKPEVRRLSEAYQAQLLSGQTGGESSLAMFPSLLSPVALGSLREGSSALVAEVGGTNLYGALVKVKDGRPEAVWVYQSTLPVKTFTDAGHFYHSIAKGVEPLAGGELPDAVGIVYSFPGEARVTRTGVDIASPETLTKGFEVPGISRVLVGEGFRRALGRLHNLSIDDIPTVVLNDTVAVAFSAGAKMGGVVGTGFNIATETGQGIVNTESGGFNIGYSHDLADIINRESGHPGVSLAEKQIAGLYLGQQMSLAAKMEADRLGLDINTGSITASTISELLEGRIKGLQVPVLTAVAGRLRDRSAQIVGIMMGTIAKTFPQIFNESTAVVPVEGSVFWGIPDYHEIVAKVANDISGQRFEFVNIKDAGRIGAAVAALGILRQ